MSEILVQLALGNLVVSAVLAGAAYVVHRHGRYPASAHLLWVLVLLKLVTPPLVLVPLLPQSTNAVVTPGAGNLATAVVSSDAGPDAWLLQHGITLLLLTWAVGSLVVLAVTLVRIHRFDGTLRRSAVPVPAALQAMADDIGARYGLRTSPAIVTTAASISPMTWWTGRRVLVAIPASLVEHLSTTQLRWVLAHELAHVKRHDHVVRWLEWLACVSFWWNPIAWWARRNLHHDEEASCDAFVLAHLDHRPRSYARALLAVVELMARPSLRPPAVATGVDGGSLERRFALIVSSGRVRPAPRSMAAAILAVAVVALPLGIGAAHESEGGAPDPAEATAGAPVTPAIDAAEPGYRPVSASVGADGATGSAPRAERTLRVAQRKLLQADRALKQDIAPRKAQRKLQEARQALRKAERQVERTADASGSLKRELRETRQSLRQATRALRRALAEDRSSES